MYYFKISYFFKLLICINFYISSILYIYDKYMLLIKNIFKKNSTNFYKDEADKKKALRKGKKYFRLCEDDILKNYQYFSKNEEPLISVVIPVYNAEFKIKRAIRSIQNQNTSNLEIILIDDFSKDKTIDIIRDLQINDGRIILLENKENRGIFYTRCIGTLNAKGKYIFPLDNDDLFFDESILDSISNEAIKGDFDIVEFMYSEYYKFNKPPNKLISTEFGNHSHNLILNQPELSLFPRKKNNSFGVYDCFLWAKCINSTLYKNCINQIGYNLYSKFILRGEDFIMSFVLFRFARSFKFFAKYGIFRFKSRVTATFQSSREMYLLSRIIYLNVIIKFTDKNYKDKMYVVYFSNEFLPIINKEYNTLNRENKQYLKIVLRKLIKNRYIKDSYKKTFVSLCNNISFQK